MCKSKQQHNSSEVVLVVLLIASSSLVRLYAGALSISYGKHQDLSEYYTEISPTETFTCIIGSSLEIYSLPAHLVKLKENERCSLMSFNNRIGSNESVSFELWVPFNSDSSSSDYQLNAFVEITEERACLYARTCEILRRPVVYPLKRVNNDIFASRITLYKTEHTSTDNNNFIARIKILYVSTAKHVYTENEENKMFSKRLDCTLNIRSEEMETNNRGYNPKQFYTASINTRDVFTIEDMSVIYFPPIFC